MMWLKEIDDLTLFGTELILFIYINIKIHSKILSIYKLGVLHDTKNIASKFNTTLEKI